MLAVIENLQIINNSTIETCKIITLISVEKNAPFYPRFGYKTVSHLFLFSAMNG